MGRVCGRARAHLGSLEHPDIITLSLLYTSLCRAKRDPKTHMLSLQSFLPKRRVVGLCWAQFKPNGSNGRSRFICYVTAIQDPQGIPQCAGTISHHSKPPVFAHCTFRFGSFSTHSRFGSFEFWYICWCEAPTPKT